MCVNVRAQPPSYSFVVFSEDKPPVTITEVQLCFLNTLASHESSDERNPKAFGSKVKNIHLHVTFV